MTQFEDNATKSLWLILNGNIEPKKKFIVDFMIKGKHEYQSDNFYYAETQVTTSDDTRPDLVLYFNDGKTLRVEVKDKNSELTPSEKEAGTRDLFLIPKSYKEEGNIPTESTKIYWEDFFEELDEKFCGKYFDELALTRNCLGIVENSSFTKEEIAAFLNEEFVNSIKCYFVTMLEKIAEEFPNNTEIEKFNDNNTSSGFYLDNNREIGIAVCPQREIAFHISIDFYNYDKLKNFGVDKWSDSVCFPLNYEDGIDEVKKKINTFVTWYNNGCDENSFPGFRTKGTPIINASLIHGYWSMKEKLKKFGSTITYEKLQESVNNYPNLVNNFLFSKTPTEREKFYEELKKKLGN